MINLVWNGTLNRLGAGALWFFIASSLSGGVNYLRLLSFTDGQTGDSKLLEGMFFIVGSYFLGSVLVGLGRSGTPWQSAICWEPEFARVANENNTFLQSALMSHVDRSDAFAGLGAALLIFFPVGLGLFVLGLLTEQMRSLEESFWLIVGGGISFQLLRLARTEHRNAKTLLAEYDSLKAAKQ